jgi:hypothetical protein
MCKQQSTQTGKVIHVQLYRAERAIESSKRVRCSAVHQEKWANCCSAAQEHAHAAGRSYYVCTPMILLTDNSSTGPASQERGKSDSF